jgi:predicted acylesterase/phospholipase RssA
MKGGVTSGTVYPKAIAALSEKYRFRSIGGTSAGAIAAGAAAAAEYRRQTSGGKDKGGFAALDALPGKLGEDVGSGKSKLLSLFQPQPLLKPLFDFLLSFVGGDRTSDGKAKSARRSGIESWLLVGRVSLNAMASFPIYALGGAVAMLGALYALGVQWDAWWRIAVLAAAAFAGASAAAFWGVWRKLQALPPNGFGMCRGFDPEAAGKADRPAHLTDWLHQLIQDLAGLQASGAPLTFGNLKGAGVNFVAMTTNLSQGHPFQLPLGKRSAWAFYEESVWKRYFPAEVLAHMKKHRPSRAVSPQNAEEQKYAAAAQRLEKIHGLLPFPDEGDFPVVVAVRMSLSFPVLLSAVPVHILDPRDKEKGDAKKCWFSDGGISSNFPLHLFDGPVPGRPTFAINLEDVEPSVPEKDRVVLPEKNNEGLARPWKGIDEKFGADGLSAFLLAIVNVMQNWHDNALLRLPGYRDRVASVQLAPNEGGLNLNMPKELITLLSGRGEQAAGRLILHFDPANAAACKAQGIETTWENQRWIRLLTALTGLERLAGELKDAWTIPVDSSGTYRELLDPVATPVVPSYRNFSRAQRERALKCLDAVEAALSACCENAPAVSMKEHTPRPHMHFRLTPDA